MGCWFYVLVLPSQCLFFKNGIDEDILKPEDFVCGTKLAKPTNNFILKLCNTHEQLYKQLHRVLKNSLESGETVL